MLDFALTVLANSIFSGGAT